ncbi:hypothetical protein [Citrifermentans bemidjiense]|uniref:hypothetical protein n=1 Tax=Citrifermentans bemidjiense TaxID=225194 RepID=UPI00017BF99B|nr:hypothetical protein [Citrifermentans bemidjiense]
MPKLFLLVILLFSLILSSTGVEPRRIGTDVRGVISSGYNRQEVTRNFIGKDVAGLIQKPYMS